MPRRTSSPEKGRGGSLLPPLLPAVRLLGGAGTLLAMAHVKQIGGRHGPGAVARGTADCDDPLVAPALCGSGPQAANFDVDVRVLCHQLALGLSQAGGLTRGRGQWGRPL